MIEPSINDHPFLYTMFSLDGNNIKKNCEWVSWNNASVCPEDH